MFISQSLSQRQNQSTLMVFLHLLLRRWCNLPDLQYRLVIYWPHLLSVLKLCCMTWWWMPHPIFQRISGRDVWWFWLMDAGNRKYMWLNDSDLSILVIEILSYLWRSFLISIQSLARWWKTFSVHFYFLYHVFSAHFLEYEERLSHTPYLWDIQKSYSLPLLRRKILYFLKNYLVWYVCSYLKFSDCWLTFKDKICIFCRFGV